MGTTRQKGLWMQWPQNKFAGRCEQFARPTFRMRMDVRIRPAKTARLRQPHGRHLSAPGLAIFGPEARCIHTWLRSHCARKFPRHPRRPMPAGWLCAGLQCLAVRRLPMAAHERKRSAAADNTGHFDDCSSSSGPLLQAAWPANDTPGLLPVAPNVRVAASGRTAHGNVCHATPGSARSRLAFMVDVEKKARTAGCSL